MKITLPIILVTTLLGCSTLTLQNCALDVKSRDVLERNMQIHIGEAIMRQCSTVLDSEPYLYKGSCAICISHPFEKKGCESVLDGWGEVKFDRLTLKVIKVFGGM